MQSSLNEVYYSVIILFINETQFYLSTGKIPLEWVTANEQEPLTKGQ